MYRVMKKIFFSILIIWVTNSNLVAQNIGINATGASPHPSAMLDVSSTSKGLLMPRMTTAQRNAIVSPAEGLKVYDTNTKTFWFYNGSGWIQSATGSPTNFWSINGTNIFNNNGGNVGIGNGNPANNKLEIGTAPGFLNNDLAIGNGVAGMSFLQTNTASIWYTSKDFALMPASGTGNLGIGTITPISKLTIQTPDNTDGFTHLSAGGINLTERVGGVSASIGTVSNHTFRLIANGIPTINLDGFGNVGVGITDQIYKMDISDRIRIRSGSGSSTAGIWLNNPSNSAAFAFLGTKDVDQVGIYGNNAGWSLIMNTNNGNVGIGSGVPNPSNKLQIGSVGATGFATNDLAIGNGTNAVGILQTNSATYIGATTDIILMPRNNGHGRVGINTSTPRAPLDVVDFVSVASSYSYFNRGGFTNGILDCNGCQSAASIIVSNAIIANEFDAYSDARIKSIVGISNTAKDLETIDALQITDYVMKDRVKYGNKYFKKVIAQEVEKVYPQVVSKHTDFIPNVYQLTTKVEKIAGGWLLSFSNDHNISSTAKKLKVLLGEQEGMKEVEIVSIPSSNQVIISSNELNADKIFVYGEEVNDFRTVDYEGLTTLNISATQELSKLIKKQQETIDLLEKRLEALEAKK